jgi:hypothetical protein
MKHDTAAFHPFGRTSRDGLWEPARSAALPREGFVPAGRTLHLVDVENLMGGPLSGPIALQAAVAAYNHLAPVRCGDHVIVGVNPGLALAVFDVWPRARLVVRGGPDGADNALIACVGDVAWTASRYDRLVVGSGDGIFSVVIAAYRAAGIPVGVVARPSSLSLSMVAIASTVALIPRGKDSLA